MKKYLLFLCYFLFFTLSSFGQYSTTNKKAIKLYEEADILIKARQNWDRSTALLQQAIEKDPAFVEAYLKLAGIHKIFGKNDLVRIQFEKVAEIKPDSKDLMMVYYTLGEYSLNDGDYEKAKKQFDKIASMNSSDKKILEGTNRYLRNCNFAIEAKKNPVAFKPVPLSNVVNQFYLNAYPVLTADQQTLIYYRTTGASPSDNGDIVISKMINGQWSSPVSISDKINTKFDEGTCTISADGKILVFSSCNRKDGIGACDLYISYKKEDEWTVPVNMGTNVNSSAWDSEASLSADGRALYFSSERRGGSGLADIWMTWLNDKDEWMPAINLGSSINTPGREVSPFIHADGRTLYFCSNYHPGMGQFDIFTSRKNDSTWTAPKNIGYPINTHLNDVTVFITPDNKKGLYVIYEKEGMKLGQSKIYEFEVSKELAGENSNSYTHGTVYDSETKKKIGAKIELIDLKTNKTIQSVNADSKNGDYLIILTEGKEYALYVQREGYLFKSIFFDYNNPKNFDPLTLDVYLDPIKAGNTIVLNNIFFASNSYALEDKSKTELDKIILFLQTNPKVNIEFGGHTDDVGSDKDNQQLSLKRAKAVYDYIVGKGIVISRLKYNGYGETKPLVPNTSEENRLLNRRIEFKVL